MLEFSYIEIGAGLPPAPIVWATIYPPEWEKQLSQNPNYSCTAFLDTGSDCTLIPLEAISALNLTTFKANAQIIRVGGGGMQGIGCYINISIGTRHFSAIRAYACQLKDLNGNSGSPHPQRSGVGKDSEAR